MVKIKEENKLFENNEKRNLFLEKFSISFTDTRESSILISKGLDVIDNELPFFDKKTIYSLADQEHLLFRRSKRIYNRKKKANSYQSKTIITIQNATSEVFGALLFRFHESYFAEILLMAVKSEYQGKKLGTVLLNGMKSIIPENISRILVKSDNNCIEFYEKNGFSKVEKNVMPEDLESLCLDSIESVLMECKRLEILKIDEMRKT